MKKFLLLFSLVCLSLFTFSQEFIFKFKIDSKEEIKKLTRIISIDNYQNGEITAYANKEEFETFKSFGYEYQLLPHPGVGKSIIMATTVAQMANWDRYPTYDVYIQMMNDFATDYPDLCQVVNIGTSEDGRELIAVKISDNVSIHEAEPEFFYTGTMHGDETTGFVLLLRLIDHLLSSYGTDSRITSLVNNTEIYINPAANPDGTYNGGNNTVSNATRYNSNGVDLNRNFPSPNDVTPSGMNESEIQSMITFAEDHHFVFSANTHGGIEVLNFPWDSWTSSVKTHSDHNWLYHVCRSYADTVHIYSPSSYMDSYDNGVTHGGDWYVVDGSRQDHMTYYQHCREITVELSIDKLLDVENLPAHWNYNKSAFIGFIEEMHFGFNGIVTDELTGDPLNAKIEITSHDEDNSEVYTDPLHGDYYRPIEPGTYNVTYSSEGYISETHSVTVTDWETTTIMDVQLAQAAQVTVTGTVTENGSGNPVSGVKIDLLGTSIPAVFTNIDGTYSISNVFEGEHQIKASKSGYTSVTQTVNISTSNTVVDFVLTISNAISFESEIPSIFTFSGNLPWTRVFGEAYDGDYSMKSGGISHDQISVMETELNILSAGNISFYKKVSSESGYDFLKFYIDEIEQDDWSGTVAWSQESYAVSTGIHTFKWEYSKDGSVSNGDDCAWVDYIEFPVYQQAATYNVTFNVSDGTNPIEGANVSFNSQNIITNSGGQAVFTEVEPGSNLPWEVSKTGYTTETGTVTVSDDNVEQNVTLTELISYTVTFNVDDGTNPLAGANINFNSENILTDAIGQAVFSTVFPGDNIPYIITKDGYETFNNTISVIDENVIENVSVYLTTYTVSFSVTDGTDPIEGANINFNSEDILTNTEGLAEFNNVAPGNSLPYSISKTGYNTFNGTISVTDQNVLQNIVLSEDISVNVILNLEDIKVSPNPFNDHINIEFFNAAEGSVFVAVYAYNGILINVLSDKNLPAGNLSITWNGTTSTGGRCENGNIFLQNKNRFRNKN